jgi:O-antigen/teichoic acid export membrane protein
LEKVLQSIKRIIFENKLFFGGLILTASNLLTGILGYFFQILMGRMLTPIEFGLLSAILSLGMFCASPLNALALVVARRVAFLAARGAENKLKSLIFRLHARTICIAVGLALVYGALLPQIGALMNVDHGTYLWLFFIYMVFVALSVICNAVLQGLELFALLSVVGITGVVLKIIVAQSLLISGLGIFGVIVAIALSAFFVWILAGWFALARLQKPAISGLEDMVLPKANYIPILCATVAFAALTQLDMVLVKKYFSPDQAGQYAAAAVLGKAILYLPGGLVLALFPLVAKKQALMGDPTELLLQSLAATALVCLAIALGFNLFSRDLIEIFYGPQYADAAKTLKWFGFAITPMALIFVAEHFLIAQGRVFFVWLLAVVAPMQVLAVHVWHEELWMVVAFIGTSGCLILFFGVLFAITIGKQKT